MTSSVETAEYTNESRAATSGRLARSASRPDPLVPCGSIHIAPTPVPAPAPATTAARRFLATVLFVDMVDSTRRAVELGDSGWLDLQEAHEAMLRRSVGRFGGRSLQALGDGLVAIFDSAAAGVGCGTMIADASRRMGVEVRAGLHAGECERRGKRLGGIVFHIAARVLSRAGASEVLVSRTVKELVSGAGFVLTRRGTHRLKGLPGEWPLFAVNGSREREGEQRT